MKKVFLVLTAAAVMVACNNKKKTEGEVKTDTATTTTTTTDKMDNNTTTTTTTSTDVPKFADAEVQKYVDDYTAWVNMYVDAYKSKDMTKISNYSMKAQEWSTRSASVAQKLAGSPEEAKKFTDYMTKLSTDLANAAKAMMPAQ